MTAEAVLELRNVQKSYELHTAKTLRRSGKRADRLAVLKDISFAVGHGETVGVLGRNGAGKSTLLKMICRVTAPDAGEVRVAGRVGSLLEVGTGFHPELTGRENVFLNAAILGMRANKVTGIFDEIVEFAEMGHAIDKPLKHYSSGMQVRLGFSVAAHLDCDLLLMDEVLAVGDALFQARCLEKLHQLCSEEGRTALIVSHAMAPIARLCSRVMVFESGDLTFDGDTGGGIAHYIRSLQGEFTAIGSVVDLSRRNNPFGDDLWFQSVETEAIGRDRGLRTYTVRIHLPATTRRPLILGWGLSDNVGMGLTSGYVELPVIDAAKKGQTIAVRLSIPLGSIAPGVYFLDMGISAGLGGAVIDQVHRAVSINSDVLPPEEWRVQYGDARIVLPVESSWRVEKPPRGGKRR